MKHEKGGEREKLQEWVKGAGGGRGAKRDVSYLKKNVKCFLFVVTHVQCETLNADTIFIFYDRHLLGTHERFG